MFDQHNACQLEEDEVLHIHVEICDKKTEEFIQQSPNPSTQEIFHSVTVTKLRLLYS